MRRHPPGEGWCLELPDFRAGNRDGGAYLDCALDGFNYLQESSALHDGIGGRALLPGLKRPGKRPIPEPNPRESPSEAEAALIMRVLCGG